MCSHLLVLKFFSWWNVLSIDTCKRHTCPKERVGEYNFGELLGFNSCDISECSLLLLQIMFWNVCQFMAPLLSLHLNIWSVGGGMFYCNHWFLAPGIDWLNTAFFSNDFMPMFMDIEGFSCIELLINIPVTIYIIWIFNNWISNILKVLSSQNYIKRGNCRKGFVKRNLAIIEHHKLQTLLSSFLIFNQNSSSH